jgi:dipeptidyl aminopeptidase/acylaminoacyl peptidase
VPVAACGSWKTPITSAVVVTAAVRLSGVRVDGDDVIWAELRPTEGGRTQLVRRSAGGDATDLLPEDHNARTAVHEYGGGAWWVRDRVVWFASWADQRLYRLDPTSGSAEPLTPEPAQPRGDRYADGDLSPDGRWIACVREHHPPGGRGAIDVRNEIVRLAAHEPSEPQALVSGPDFVSAPRWSRRGDRLCWIEWDHPAMPWEGTRLKVRDLASDTEVLVAGGPRESVSEPRWQPDGSLTFISDRTGWWNLYRWPAAGGAVEPLVVIDAEIGVPQWVFGTSRYAILPDGRVVFARVRAGFDGLAMRTPDGAIHELDLPFASVAGVTALGDSSVVLIADTPTSEASVCVIAVEDPAAPAVAVLRPPRDLTQLGVSGGYLSVPEPIDFRSAGGRTAHALFYRPANEEFDPEPGELPPLLVEVHGGPTGRAAPGLDLDIQYWTSRGFAFVDVNYGGSTGYGRDYRELLRGQWGIVDIEDSVAAARWLAEQGWVDPARLCIRGGSAGGYTTLAALSREDTPFTAGASYFGIAELEALSQESHKFESRYNDSLIGPYPQARDLYRERSPIHHVDSFKRPLIVLQGLEDEVVPPNQAEMIVDALRRNRVPVTYLPFEGEQHGFRRAENIRLALDGELSFYSQVLGFPLPEHEGIEPVTVENLAH